MELSTHILGKTAVDILSARPRMPILRIGSDEFSRRDFAALDCFNFAAASNLDYLLNKHLKVKDTHDLYMNVNPSELALPRMGAISLATLSAAFEKKGLGGDNPLESWLKRHTVKFATWGVLKDRELDDIRKEKRNRRERKAIRRNMAHTTRVTRFEARRTGTHN
jgi:hypothetical protein